MRKAKATVASLGLATRRAKATVASLGLATRRTELRAGGDRVVDGIVDGVVVDHGSSWCRGVLRICFVIYVL